MHAVKARTLEAMYKAKARTLKTEAKYMISNPWERGQGQGLSSRTTSLRINESWLSSTRKENHGTDSRLNKLWWNWCCWVIGNSQFKLVLFLPSSILHQMLFIDHTVASDYWIKDGTTGETVSYNIFMHVFWNSSYRTYKHQTCWLSFAANWNF